METLHRALALPLHFLLAASPAQAQRNPAAPIRFVATDAGITAD
ncbi:MAG TPA: hypothetical protein VLV90_01500 [Burkholderiales bacterium]|nr:hypothetical protein [Burkholderiales bacterium]